MANRLASAVRWITKDQRLYVYAAGAGLLYASVTIKLFWFSDAAFLTAATGIYSGMAYPTAAFIAAAIGMKVFGPQPGPGPFHDEIEEPHDRRK